MDQFLFNAKLLLLFFASTASAVNLSDVPIPSTQPSPLSTEAGLEDGTVPTLAIVSPSPVPDETLPIPEDFWEWVQRQADAGEVIPEFTPATHASSYGDDLSLPEGEPSPSDEPEDAFLALPKGPQPLLTLKELYQACSLKQSTPLGGVVQRYVSTPHLRNDKKEAIGRFVCRHFARALVECADRMGVPARIVGFNCDCSKRVAELNADAAKPEVPEVERQEIRNKAYLLRRGLEYAGHMQVLVAVANSAEDRDKVEFTLVDGQGNDDFSLKDLKAVVVGTGKISDWKTKAAPKKPFVVNAPARLSFARKEVGGFMCGNWKCEYNPATCSISQYRPQAYFSVSNEGTLKALWSGDVDVWEPSYVDPTRGDSPINVVSRLIRRSTVKKNDFGDEGVCKYRLRTNAALRCEYRENDDEEDDLSKPGPLNP